MSFELRDYQRDAITLTVQRLDEGHTPIICAPTGSGKTVIAAHMARTALDLGKRVMWMTPREEILWQAFKTFDEVCRTNSIAVLMRDEPYWRFPDVTLASWHTLRARWDKSDLWHVPADLVLVDEAHLALSERMNATVMPFYRNQHVVGFTATPARRSGRGLGSYFTRIVQVRSVSQLMDEGFLARCEYWAGTHVDTEKLPVSPMTRDYAEHELAEASHQPHLIGDVIDNWLRLASDRHTIVFAVDIAHAQALKSRFEQAGVSADCIHIKMAHTTRTHVSNAFRKGELRVLVNVGICTYGYDVPSVNCVVLARPTKSIVLHHQMIGRGLRPKENGDYCMVLDHGDNVRRLGCVEDEIRWRLDERKEAAHNATRRGDPTRDKRPDETMTTCENCQHIFSRSRVCPKCGWEKPVVARDVKVVDANLVKIAKAQPEVVTVFDRARWYQMALGWVLAHGQKSGAAYYAYRDKFGEAPLKSYSELGPLEPDLKVHGFMMRKRIAFMKSRAASG